MFDKLIDFLISIIELFRFFWVIRTWEAGIILRFGKWTGKVMKPGFHFIFPFAIDEVHTIILIPQVAELDAQTVMTRDRMVVVVQALVKYEVYKPEICLIDVANEEDALKEFTQGALHTVITETDYSSVNIRDIETKAVILARKEVSKWGIKIHSIVIKSFGKMNTIRLIQQ